MNIIKGLKPLLVASAISLAVGAHSAHAHDALFQLGDREYGANNLPPAQQQALFDARLRLHNETQVLINESLLLMAVEQRARTTEKSNTEVLAELFADDEPSDEMDLLISEINKSDLGWKADTCKYQKTHPLYG